MLEKVWKASYKSKTSINSRQNSEKKIFVKNGIHVEKHTKGYPCTNCKDLQSGAVITKSFFQKSSQKTSHSSPVRSFWAPTLIYIVHQLPQWSAPYCVIWDVLWRHSTISWFMRPWTQKWVWPTFDCKVDQMTRLRWNSSSMCHATYRMHIPRSDNKYVYRQSHGWTNSGSECSLIIRMGCWVQVFPWSSIAQSVCKWAFSLLAIWFLRLPRFESCIQQRKTTVSFRFEITPMCQSTIKIKQRECITKFQVDILKHVEKSPEHLDGRTNGLANIASA